MGGHILVTGGAGFIGSHVCERLINSNEKVICIDNFNDFYNPGLKENNIKDIVRNPNFRLYRASITDFDKVKDIFNTLELSWHSYSCHVLNLCYSTFWIT